MKNLADNRLRVFRLYYALPRNRSSPLPCKTRIEQIWRYIYMRERDGDIDTNTGNTHNPKRLIIIPCKTYGYRARTNFREDFKFRGDFDRVLFVKLY